MLLHATIPFFRRCGQGLCSGQAIGEFQFVQPGFPSSYWGIRIRGAWSSLKLFVNSNLRSLVFPSYWGIRTPGAWSSLTLFLNSNLWGLVFSQAIRDFQLVVRIHLSGCFQGFQKVLELLGCQKKREGERERERARAGVSDRAMKQAKRER